MTKGVLLLHLQEHMYKERCSCHSEVLVYHIRQQCINEFLSPQDSGIITGLLTCNICATSTVTFTYTVNQKRENPTCKKLVCVCIIMFLKTKESSPCDHEQTLQG